MIFSGFFEPLFYLFALGTGLHNRSSARSSGRAGTSISYTAFIAPALLASSAMNGAIFDSTINVFFKLKYAKLYDSMLATSLGPLDVAIGEISWALIRGGLYSAGFLVVMVAMGLTASWWAVLLLPAALLIALRVRVGRDGVDVLHEEHPGPRPGRGGDPAAVPVQRDVLQPVRLPGVAAGRRRVPAAAARHRAVARR